MKYFHIFFVRSGPDNWSRECSPPWGSTNTEHRFAFTAVRFCLLWRNAGVFCPDFLGMRALPSAR